MQPCLNYYIVITCSFLRHRARPTTLIKAEAAITATANAGIFFDIIPIFVLHVSSENKAFPEHHILQVDYTLIRHSIATESLCEHTEKAAALMTQRGSSFSCN